MTSQPNIGVSSVNRSCLGTCYIITRNDDSRIVVGRVEAVGEVYGVRDAFNEPVPAGSVKYELLIAAVKAYRSWAEKH